MTDVPCPDDARIQAYVERRLDADERAAIDDHLDACGSCRRLVAMLICKIPETSTAQRHDPSGDTRGASDADVESRLGELLAALSAEPDAPPPGEIVADRFLLLGVAGKGGMGVVFQAYDDQTQTKVALKILSAPSAEPVRFQREADALAKLDHPAVVRYVDHGRAEGLDYLAMEWLEGETLRARLRREPLTLNEALTLGIRVAEGIAEAHRLGLIHRDLKPSNLILVHGDVARTKVIDFGLTRRAGFPTHWTGTNVVGTPGYLAPEQARGDALDERTDLFSLGAILHETIARQPPFTARGKTALLAKVLLEPAQPLDHLIPGLDAELADLVLAMLEKNPALRPATAMTVAETLERIRDVAEEGSPRSTRALTRGERELVIVLVVGASNDEERVDAELHSWLAEVARLEEARHEPLATGPSLLSWKAADAPDCARRAAAVALEIAARAPRLPIGLSTVRIEVGMPVGAGEAIERAASLAHLTPRRGVAALDELTAALVADRFEIASHDDERWLRGRVVLDEPRTVLGRPTPLVGRETELAMVLAAFEASLSASEAQAVLLTGGAGMGKTRLRRAVVTAIRERVPTLRVWTAAADPLEIDAAGALLGRLLGRAAGLDERTSRDQRRERLRAFVRSEVTSEDANRISDFAIQMAGLAAVQEPEHEALRAALQSVAVMREQRRRSLVQLLESVTATGPLVLVLEDLQWADTPSLELVDYLLEALAQRPVMVLATARPALDERLPDLWSRAPCQRVRLDRLRDRAARRLVDAVLAPDESPTVTDAIRSEIVARAEGHPLSLEELIRAAVEGSFDLAPKTVLALFQSRLARMEPVARRVLRAATFFGVSFHAGSVAALLGGDPPEEEVQRWLEALITREVLEPAASDGPRAYRFRHDLYRESADASLTDADRTTGHRLAGRWLAEHRAADPAVIAEHLQRGDRTAEAARWFVRAADQALRADDFEGAVAFGERAVKSGAEDELLGEVRAIQAEGHQWRGDDESMEAAAIEALGRLSPEHPRYGPAAGLGALSAFRRGRPERTVAIAEELLGYLRQRQDVSYPLALAGIYCAEHVHLTGRHELGAILLALVETKAADKVQHDPLLAAARAKARARAAAHSADAAGSARFYAQAAEAYDVIGDRRLAATMRGAHGCMMSELGAFEKAASGLEKALEETRHLGLTSITAAFEHNLAIAYARSGRLHDADEQQRSALTYYRAQGFERMVAGCHIWLALTALERGALDDAERHAAEAVAQEKAGEPVRAYSLAVSAKVALAAGRNDEARELADKASVILSRIGHLDEGESLARLVHAQALLASGDDTGARRAIAAARTELLARADRITEPELRQSFLERVAENAATLELVERLGHAS